MVDFTTSGKPRIGDRDLTRIWSYLGLKLRSFLVEMAKGTSDWISSINVECVSACCAGGLPIESRHPTSATYVTCRERDWLPC